MNDCIVALLKTRTPADAQLMQFLTSMKQMQLQETVRLVPSLAGEGEG
jgi:hypothetical protein